MRLNRPEPHPDCRYAIALGPQLARITAGPDYVSWFGLTKITRPKLAGQIRQVADTCSWFV
jgi:hypothetical protein